MHHTSFDSDRELTDGEIRRMLIRQVLAVCLKKVKEIIFAKQKASCFICYSIDDTITNQWVSQLADDLNATGIKVFIDKNNFPQTNIIRFSEKVSTSDFAIVIGTTGLKKKWSEYISSDAATEEAGIPYQGYYVCRELEIIIGRKDSRPDGAHGIINVLLEGTWETSFPASLAHDVGIDFRNPVDYFDVIMELIERMIPANLITDFEIIKKEYDKKKQTGISIVDSSGSVSVMSAQNLPLYTSQTGMDNGAGVGEESVEHNRSDLFYTPNFKHLVERDLFIDKSLLIKDILDSPKPINIILRPFGFGKTLNLDMLNCFFNYKRKGERFLFDKLKISSPENKRYIAAHNGQYSVIFLNFSNFMHSIRSRTPTHYTFARAFEEIKTIMSEVYRDFKKEFEEKSKDDLQLKAEYELIVSKKANIYDLRERRIVQNALRILILCIANAQDRKIILLVNDYDSALYMSYLKGYQEEMFGFIGLFLKLGLEEQSLFKSVLMGTFGIHGTEMFPEIENFQVSTIFSKLYNKHFGFLRSEVEKIIQNHKKRELEYIRKIESDFGGELGLIRKVESYYGGYLIGNEVLFPSSSIVRFLTNEWQFKDYWSIIAIKDFLRQWIDKHEKNSINSDLINLIEKGGVRKDINNYNSYVDIDRKQASFFAFNPKNSQDGLWDFLLFSGCLTCKIESVEGNVLMVQLSIPNQQVRLFYDMLATERNLRITRSPVSLREQMSSPISTASTPTRSRRPRCTIL